MLIFPSGFEAKKINLPELKKKNSILNTVHVFCTLHIQMKDQYFFHPLTGERKYIFFSWCALLSNTVNSILADLNFQSSFFFFFGCTFSL